MIEILSSILASDLLSVGSEVQRMLDNGVDSLHVDIMDAHFVPNLSFGPAMVSALKKAFPAVHQDVHLMMDNPEKYLDTFISAGAGAVTVHAEVPGDVRAMLAKIRAAGIKAGVSIKPGTGVDTIKELLPLCDLVLVMTVLIASFVFPLLSRFRNTVASMLRNALLLSVSHLPRALLAGVINAFPWVLMLVNFYAFLRLGILWFSLYFSAAAYYNSRLLKKVFDPLEEASEQQPQ